MASFNRRTYGGEGSESFTSETASATEVYMLEADADDPDLPTRDDVNDTIRVILGWTEYQPDTKLRRHLPLAHPRYPNLCAQRVQVRPADETGFSVEASDEELEAEPPPDYPLFEAYEFTIEYGPRPFAMISDSRITRRKNKYYDIDGVPVDFFFNDEWVRYTDIELLPTNEILKAKQGQYLFRSSAGAPNGSPFPAVVQMPLPNELLRVTWYGVPFRFVKSPRSYLRKFRNQINQQEFLGYAPGSLLFKSYDVKRYTPPFAELDPAWELGVFSTEKLCNIVFDFLLTDRVITGAPVDAPPNGNYLMMGWNLLPWLQTRRYYYATSTTGVPSFFSAPFELLFQDPDA